MVTPQLYCKHLYLCAILLEMTQKYLSGSYRGTWVKELKNFQVSFKLKHFKNLVLKIHQSMEQNRGLRNRPYSWQKCKSHPEEKKRLSTIFIETTGYLYGKNLPCPLFCTTYKNYFEINHRLSAKAITIKLLEKNLGNLHDLGVGKDILGQWKQ
jgi:hypothetical protein